MAASATRNRLIEIPPGMKLPLIISGALHVVLTVVAITGLPHLVSDPPPIATAIPIEILPISELTTTNRPQVRAQPAPEKEITEKPVQRDVPPPPPKVDAVEPPKEPPKPKEEPKPVPKPVAPPPPEALKEPEPQPKPEEKPPPEEKPVEPETQQDFASLLRNLQESTPVVEDNVPESKTAEAPAPSPLAAFSQQLTMSEADALRQQLSRCWSIQAGARYAENLVVEVRMTVNRDRRVMSATITDQWRYSQDSYFRAAADSALRAINSPQCEVLNLPPEKYELWKDIVVRFDPREML